MANGLIGLGIVAALAGAGYVGADWYFDQQAKAEVDQFIQSNDLQSRVSIQTVDKTFWNGETALKGVMFKNLNNGESYPIDSIVVSNYKLQDQIPVAMNIEVKGMHIPAGEAKDLGYTEFLTGFRMMYVLDPQKQTLDIVDYSVTIKDAGTIGMSLHLDEVDVTKLQALSAAAKNDPNPLQLLSTLGQMKLGQGSFYYEEGGIMDRALDQQAKQRGVDKAVLKQQTIADLDRSIQEAGFRDQAGLAKIKQIVQDGRGRITFNFAPTTSTSFNDLGTLTTFGGPQAIIDKLQIKVE